MRVYWAESLRVKWQSVYVSMCFQDRNKGSSDAVGQSSTRSRASSSSAAVASLWRSVLRARTRGSYTNPPANNGILLACIFSWTYFSPYSGPLKFTQVIFRLGLYKCAHRARSLLTVNRSVFSGNVKHDSNTITQKQENSVWGLIS